MTESQRTWGLRALVLAVLVGLAAWLASATEWTEIEVPVPPRGEAARNRFFATQQLVKRLGGSVAAPTHLAELPPANATLVLTSWHWDLFPERAKRLREWVEAGGHLVLFADTLNHEEFEAWLPVRFINQRERDREDDEDEEDEETDEGESDKPQEPQKPEVRRDAEGKPLPPLPPAIARRLQLPCITATEPEGVAPYYADGQRRYELCGVVSSSWNLQTRAGAPSARWSLDGRQGPLLLRAAKGRGEVTVLQPWALLDNDRVLKSDNALAAIAALKAGPGVTVWFISEEARPSLLAWLWHEAWVAVLFGLAALGVALWRNARRFGPLAAGASTARRSMGEQIAGTAQFLRRRGPQALVDAQVRALEAVARLHVRQFDTLDRGQRAAAIAKHTGLDASALALALDRKRMLRPTDLPGTLELLETARRLLAQRRAPTGGATPPDPRPPAS